MIQVLIPDRGVEQRDETCVLCEKTRTSIFHRTFRDGKPIGLSCELCWYAIIEKLGAK